MDAAATAAPIESPIAGQVRLALHPKQYYAFTSPATEVLYGGAAGGGKSHLMRASAITWALEIPGLQVYVFRRVEDDLIKNHMEGPKGFRNLLAPLVAAGQASIIETEIRFANGSRIYLCHCKDESHRYKYHGAEIHVLMVDELTTFTEVIYRYLRFRVRMVGLRNRLPAKYRAGKLGPHGRVNTHDLFPRILCGSNPGNVGHHWVKRTFVECERPLVPKRTPDIEGGMVRAYVPALLDDNPSMAEDDPTYRTRMRGLGDPALVRAMELGDWNILAGGFFPEFSLERHVLEACTLPERAFSKRFRAHDWGSAAPFSSGWYAIADEPWEAKGTLGNAIVVPRGSLVRYREWYGCQETDTAKGVKLPVGKWARGLLERTPIAEDVLYDVADPSMFAENGGPSLAEAAMTATRAPNGEVLLMLRKADNRRIGALGRGIGWDAVRGRLQGDEDGRPLLYLMDNQPHAIRTLQSVEHDDLKPEDLNTDQEDHAVDELRYACMSRPRAVTQPVARRPKGPKPWTMQWLDQVDREQMRERSSYRIE